jgi:ubiquinone/menaquinone biosynthesis C-methylase UbiE
MAARRPAGDTALVRHPLFARAYAHVSEREAAEQVEHRRETLAGLRGRVIEVGAGNGRNFGFYPPEVDEVVAVEPEPYLRACAERASAAAAAAAGINILVHDAVAGALPFEDASFDAAVACLVLCSVPDQAAALAELRRVLRPDGELRFLEHVQAERQPLRAVLSFAGRSRLWPCLAGGCHPGRDTLRAIEAAGFTVTGVRRFDFSPKPPLPAVPHILGRATPGVGGSAREAP